LKTRLKALNLKTCGKFSEVARSPAEKAARHDLQSGHWRVSVLTDDEFLAPLFHANQERAVAEKLSR